MASAETKQRLELVKAALNREMPKLTWFRKEQVARHVDRWLEYKAMYPNSKLRFATTISPVLRCHMNLTVESTDETVTAALQDFEEDEDDSNAVIANEAAIYRKMKKLTFKGTSMKAVATFFAQVAHVVHGELDEPVHFRRGAQDTIIKMVVKALGLEDQQHLRDNTKQWLKEQQDEDGAFSSIFVAMGLLFEGKKKLEGEDEKLSKLWFQYLAQHPHKERQGDRARGEKADKISRTDRSEPDVGYKRKLSDRSEDESTSSDELTGSGNEWKTKDRKKEKTLALVEQLKKVDNQLKVVICYHCGRQGHKSFTCKAKKDGLPKVDMSEGKTTIRNLQRQKDTLVKRLIIAAGSYSDDDAEDASGSEDSSELEDSSEDEW
jgi:hypothetical protein